MPLFYLVLKAGRQTIPDPEGQELPDAAAARLHACAVAQQLMRHREKDSRGCRIQVCDDYLEPLFEVFFAEIDDSFEGAPQHVQASIEDVARMIAALDDSIEVMLATLSDARATLVRADLILGSMRCVRL